LYLIGFAAILATLAACAGNEQPLTEAEPPIPLEGEMLANTLDDIEEIVPVVPDEEPYITVVDPDQPPLEPYVPMIDVDEPIPHETTVYEGSVPEPTCEYIAAAPGFTIVLDTAVYEMSMVMFLDLSPRPVAAYPRGERRDFTGVPLAVILRHADIAVEHISSVTLWALDGHGASVSVIDILNEEQAFIVFEEVRENQPTLLAARDGYWAQAPFMLVMAQDPFPNRFIRYITEIVVQ